MDMPIRVNGTFHSPALGEDFVPSGLVGRGTITHQGGELDLRGRRRNVHIVQGFGCLGFIVACAAVVAVMVSVDASFVRRPLQEQPVWAWVLYVLPLGALFGAMHLSKRLGERPYSALIPLSAVTSSAVHQDGRQLVMKLNKGPKGVVFFNPGPGQDTERDRLFAILAERQEARDEVLAALLEAVASSYVG